MMQLNADKTKKMVIFFSQKFHSGDLPALTLEGKEVERIASARFWRSWYLETCRWDITRTTYAQKQTNASTHVTP